MAAGLQGRLLDEMLVAMPEACQLWLATHSLGMMRRASEVAAGTPGTVAFIDFEGHNFDMPVILKPIEASKPFWKRAFRIALDEVASNVAPEQVVLCEGGPLDGGKEFDAQCYNEIFQRDYPRTVFIGAGDAASIVNDRRGVTGLVKALAEGTRVSRVIDRDDRTEAERTELKASGVEVLSLRNIEAYLLHDSVLELVCRLVGKPEGLPQLLSAKEQAIGTSVAAGGQPDDLKRCAGDIYKELKRIAPGYKFGGDARAFMKGMCAPLLRESTIYPTLQQDIFGEHRS